MSQSRGGTLLFFSLVVLTVLIYCSRPDVRGRLDSPQAPSASVEKAQDSSLPNSSPEPSSTRYVRSIQLNVRSSPNGAVIGTLARGAPVGIYGNRGKWVRISRDGQPEQWVSGPNLCSEIGCAEAQSAPARSQSSDLTTSFTPIETPRYRSSASPTYDCPCSRSANCIGPRGGRYCITSGGNKRYR
ncbi:SH3 domain-containing protein [Pseudoxanthomonas japonensis]|nr:SH3 domain-containing protein [Pseudoxanthomonas japonensis]